MSEAEVAALGNHPAVGLHAGSTHPNPENLISKDWASKRRRRCSRATTRTRRWTRLVVCAETDSRSRSATVEAPGRAERQGGFLVEKSTRQILISGVPFHRQARSTPALLIERE